MIRALVGRGDEHVLYECRHCGRTLDGPEESCPECGADDVARYQL